MKLRWKKLPKETGLARVGAGPRGSVLHDGKREYASVYALGGDWRGPLRGWYWVCPTDAVGEYRNTYKTPLSDESAAKAEALAFIRERLTAKTDYAPHHGGNKD